MKHQYTLLDKIDSPKDVKKLSDTQLVDLCDELRQFIIDEVAQHPGHFGANLGVIELTVALHAVLNTPYDKLVWDVGHQAYTHKILTGRKNTFCTNRQFGGLCGFPSPKESAYDAFGVGHASTSISAALGMSIAASLKHEKRQVVAVIGDGAMTGGLAFEGLNNVSTNPNNLLVILNDNNMAIDPVHGGINHLLNEIHAHPAYNKLRWQTYKLLKKSHLINDKKRLNLIRFGNSLKALTNGDSRNNIFEGLNIRYFGPVDGHNVIELKEILQELLKHKGPKVLHIVTKKGKGYEPAEQDATGWHAPGLFNPGTGLKQASGNNKPKYQNIFGNTLLELAKKNDKIVGITPAMPSGCSMDVMLKAMPSRTFDVGIAEEHAVTFSAGLAIDGMMPFCNIYSTFIQRAYDNVIHDVAIQNLNVCFCLDRGGLVGNDGATHQGQFDIAAFRSIPNLTLSAPMDMEDLRHLMYTAQLKDMGPFIIRYPRGTANGTDPLCPMKAITKGQGRILQEGKKIAVLSYGTIGYRIGLALKTLKEETGLSLGHYDMRFAKPLDTALIAKACQEYDYIVTAEEGSIIGGFGSGVLEYMADHQIFKPIKRIGLPDNFIEHGTQSELYHMLSLDVDGLKDTLENILKQL